MTIPRRDLLKGITLGAGATLLAPLLQRAHAAATKPSPKRFVFVVESNGVRPEQLPPTGVTRKAREQRPGGPTDLIDVSLKDKDLPFSLEPVKAWKDKVTIVQGLSGRVCGGGHSNNFMALGAFGAGRGNGGESTAIEGETIDGALARFMPGIFPHIGLGISKRMENNVIYNISAWGPNKPMPTMVKPDQAYATLFGSVAGGKAREEFIAGNNLLDFMKDDVKRAAAQLRGQEREQLDAYLENFETLRHRQSRLNEIEHTLREKAPAPTNKYTSEIETDRLDAQFDVDCGITGVHAALAETGTLVLYSDAHHSRGLSLVPPLHIAIVYRRDILPDMLDHWARLRGIPGSDLPSNMVFITGPSKTADIEGELVTGVHGPEAVHIMLVEE